MNYSTLKKEQTAYKPQPLTITIDRKAALALYNEQPDFLDKFLWHLFRLAFDMAYQRENNQFRAHEIAVSLSKPVSQQPRAPLSVVTAPDKITVTLDAYPANLLYRNKPDCWNRSQWEDYRSAYIRSWLQQHRTQTRQAATAAATRPDSNIQFKPYVLAA